MKRKFLFILIFIISMIITTTVSAKTCSYQAKHKACGRYGEYVVARTCFEMSSGGGSWYGNLETDKGFPHEIGPSDSFTTFDRTKKVKFTYNTDDPNTETKDCKIKNWGEKTNGSDISGIEFVTSDECPKYMVFNTAINHILFGHCDAWVSMSEDNAISIANNIISNYNNRSFTHILELVETSQDEEEEEVNTSCLDFKDSTSCTNNDDFSCMWVKKTIGGKPYSYCNFDDLTYVKCGDAWDIPSRVPGIVSFLINLLKIATPLILIFVSVISLIKAVATSREEDIKKAQSSLVKKLIAAAIVFFIVQITQFVILKVADSSEKDNISTCLSCMLNNDCAKNIYYKTKVGTNYECTPLTGSFDGECH